MKIKNLKTNQVFNVTSESIAKEFLKNKDFKEIDVNKIGGKSYERNNKNSI